MMRWYILVPICALLVLSLPPLGGCDKTETVEEWDPTKPIEKKVGKKFELSLPADHSTGFQWQLSAPLDESIVKLVTSEYIIPNSEEEGASGIEKWTFEAVGPGETGIGMVYSRPWEEDVPPANSGTLTVIVHEK